mmetsp:Transcript_49319/g.49671  ORF Transcript_49319/g.49671 Transcript_49319/m.49671 type:complete len:89 (+) Transcript_49319:229-495(+)
MLSRMRERSHGTLYHDRWRSGTPAAVVPPGRQLRRWMRGIEQGSERTEGLFGISAQSQGEETLSNRDGKPGTAGYARALDVVPQRGWR